MLDVNNGSMAQGAVGAPGETFLYQAQFPRAQWHPNNRDLDRFFDAFVPAQYEAGFAWRCEMLGGNEANRVVPFQEQRDNIKLLIAGNAEVLLNLFQGTSDSDLDAMRQAGKVISELGIFDYKTIEIDGLPSWEPMAKAHHDKWPQTFGRRWNQESAATLTIAVIESMTNFQKSKKISSSSRPGGIGGCWRSLQTRSISS